MTRLGKRQLQRIATMAAVGRAMVVGDDVCRSLAARGLMEPTGEQTEDSFYVLTAAGFRAVANAIDAGHIRHRPDWASIRASGGSE